MLRRHTAPRRDMRATTTRRRANRHKIVEKNPEPMHADQFRAPDASDEEDGFELNDDASDATRSLRGRRFANDSADVYDDVEYEAEDAEERRRMRAWRALSTQKKVLGPGLFVVGAVMLSVYAAFAVGAVELRGNAERGTSTALVVVGSMCAAAGGWSCWVMVQVWRGEPGWSYSMIPGE
jgi:hypothetical protein